MCQKAKMRRSHGCRGQQQTKPVTRLENTHLVLIQCPQESQNPTHRRGHLIPAYRKERVCQSWLGIMGVQSSPERKCPNLHSSTRSRLKQACARPWDPGTWRHEWRQQLNSCAPGDPRGSQWIRTCRWSLLLFSSSLTVCSSHALPPHCLLHRSAALLKSPSSTHILHYSTQPPLSPHLLSFTRALSCTSMLAVAPSTHSIYITMITSMEWNSSPGKLIF